MKKQKQEIPVVPVVGLLTFSVVTLLNVITNQSPEVAVLRIAASTCLVVLGARWMLVVLRWASRN